MLSVIFLLCFSVTAVTSNPLDNVHNSLEDDEYNIAIEPPVTIPSFDLPNYLGRWYTMYENVFTRATIGRNGECVTADYGLNLNGTLSVSNNARQGGSDSTKTSGNSGYGFIPDPTEPGKIKVAFTNGGGGDYWIIKIGPKEETFPSTPLYQYAVITNSKREGLFVISRDPDDFSRFEDEILEFLEQEGFRPITIIPIVQNSECIYAGIDYEPTPRIHPG